MTDLTPRQAYWLKRVADGDGEAASGNETLRSLAKRDLIYFVSQHRAAIGERFNFWKLTAKGEALIAAAKVQAGGL